MPFNNPALTNRPIYENGFQNDKLSLLYNINKDAQIAIKSKTGVGERSAISDIIMQGTVWGSLLCTSTIDCLGKKCYDMISLIVQFLLQNYKRYSGLDC